MDILLSILLGAVGAIVRSAFAVLKSLASNKKLETRPVLLLLFVNMLAGEFLGALIVMNPAASVLAGYAGFDLLDSLHRIFSFKKIVVSLDEHSLWAKAFEYK